MTQIRKISGIAADLTSIKTDLQLVQDLVRDLESNFLLLNDLIAKGEQRRLGRVQGIGVGKISLDATKLEAVVKGKTGTYNVRVTLAPKRGHHCTCEDWARNGKLVGPCKHVLALGAAWKERRLDPELAELKTNLQNLLSAYQG